MNRLERAAVITALADKLHGHGSWCGETHLQKATYFLQDLLQVPLGYQFILYKYGPFSFDLSDELDALRADQLMELRPRPIPYGPSLLPTAASVEFRERYPRTLGTYQRSVDFVARKLGDKGVSELEQLGTALYVTRESADADAEIRARRLSELKPHVALDEAREAVASVDRLGQEAAALEQV
jgi:hypothetical protein